MQKMKDNKFEILSIAFFVVFTASSLVYYYREDTYIRPMPYFYLLSVCVGIVALQIILCINFKKFHLMLIILEAFLLSASFSLTQQAIYKTVLGRDPWFHWIFVDEIVRAGKIPSYENIPIPYTKMPNFHLLITAGMLLTGTPYKFSQYLFAGLPTLLLELLVLFALTRKVFDLRTAFLAVLILSFADNVLDMTSKSIIPNSIGVSMAFLIYYSLISMNIIDRRIFSLAILLSFSLVLTHTVSYILLLYQVIVIVLISLIYRKEISKKILNLLLILFAFAFLEWTFYSGFYFTSLINIFSQLFIYGFDIERYEARTPFSFFEVILARLGMVIFFLLTGLGIMLVLKNRFRDHVSLIHTLVTGGMVFGVFAPFSPALASISHRFWYYGEVLGSTFVSYLFNSKKMLRITAVPFLIGLSLLMFGASVSNDDNPLTPYYSQRTGWCDSEVSAGKFLILHEGEIAFASDLDYIYNLDYLKTSILASGKMERIKKAFPKTFEEVELCNCVFVFRKDQFENRLYYLGGRWTQTPHLPTKDDKLLEKYKREKNVLYANGEITMIWVGA
jgi:hypothetical protein